MTSDSSVRPDVLEIAIALCSNPEAIKQATRVIEHECHIITAPTEKISEWSLAIVRELLQGQRKL